MSQNPYPPVGGGTQFGNPAGDFIDAAPPRTSVWAIIALVVSIVGCIACIVPGPGAIAAMLGGLAIFLIARSQGRVTGIGIAVTAVVLGLFQTVAIIALLVGASQMNAQFGKEFFGPMGTTMTAVEKGDLTGARAMFTPKANAAITDEQLRDFVKHYHATAGAFQKMPESVYETITMAMELGQASKRHRGGGNYTQRPGDTTFPLPAKFAGGSALVLVSLDPTMMGSNKPTNGSGPALLNLGVLTLDGQEIWLIDPDEARKLTAKPYGYIPPKSDGSDPDSDGEHDDAPKPPAAPGAPKPDAPGR